MRRDLGRYRRGIRAGWGTMPAGMRALAAASALAGALGLIAQGLGLAGTGGGRVWAVNAGWALAGVSALAGSLVAAFRVGRGSVVWRPWALYALGSGLWIAGALSRMITAGGAGSLSPVAAICWLGFAVFGIASFATRLPRPYIFGIFLLDAIPVVLLLVSIVRVVRPAPTGIGLPDELFLNLYPALYGLLAANSIQMAGIHRDLRRTPPAVFLFTGGFCLMALAALLWVPAAVRSHSAQGHGTDLLWTIGLLGIAAAGVARAIQPSGVVPLPQVETQTGPHALPAAAAVLGLIVMLAVIPPQDRLLLQVFLLTAAVDLFARVYLIWREDLRLVAELMRSRAGAERAAARERRGAERLRRLADVTSRMKSLLLDELVQSVCDAGRELLGARYAVFGLAPSGGGPFTHFATSGLDEQARAVMVALPDGARMLGEALKAGTVRVDRLGGHPVARLLPAGHPALEGFLGVPILVSEAERAGLYLAGKAGGFDEEDESLAQLLAANAGSAIVNAELYAQSTAQREQLAAQNERLRELDRMKDEFIALVSHELRTPLTSIIGYLELVEDEDAGPLNGDQRKFVAIINRNTKRLLRLVEDLLFLSRIQSGDLAMAADTVDLAELAERAVEAARPAAGRSGIDLSLSAARIPAFTGDQTRLAQMLDNLLSNAVKFTPVGGRVTVATRVEDGSAVLAVSDTGIGIPPVDRDYVFERFFRAENAAGGAIPGSGLGLTITKAIVDAHGGAISVSSEIGRGTTFRVRLPLRRG